MATKITRRNVAYGLNSPLAEIPAAPIIQERDPGIHDQAEIGQIWINSSSDDVFTLTSFKNGESVWVTTASEGQVFSDVTITGESDEDVLTINAGDAVLTDGDITISGKTTTGTFESSGVAQFDGNVTIDANLTVTGDTDIQGDFDITSADALSFATTSNTNPALLFHANGGTDETIIIRSSQGTGADSITLDSVAGGFQIDGVIGSRVRVSGASEDLLLSSVGGSVNIAADEAVEDAVSISATDSSGGVQISANGLVSVAPDTAQEASPTAVSTQNFRVIRSTFTGFTTALSASQDFTINSNKILANSALLVQVTNLDASTNGALMTMDGVTQAAGSIVVSTTNNGSGALGSGDDVHVSVWIFS